MAQFSTLVVAAAGWCGDSQHWLHVVKIRLLRKISNLQEPDFRSTESRKLDP